MINFSYFHTSNKLLPLNLMDTLNLKLIIIDDEQDARTILRTLIQTYCPDISIVGEATDVPSAVALIREKQPDIILLDIQLGEQTGFDLLDKFTQPEFRIIFTTAYDNFALKAFEYCAMDYLLKPIIPDKLLQALDRVKANISKEKLFQQQLGFLLVGNKKKAFDKIALTTAEGIVFVQLKNILYLQSDGNYTLFYLKNEEKIIVSKTMKEFENLLPEETFFRTHQSYIVNINVVKKVLKEDGGYALLKNEKKVPISRRKKDAFVKVLMS